MAEHPLADHARFDLLDFNGETLAYAGARMEEARKRHNRKTAIKLVRKSVHHMLKEAGKPVSAEQGYDFIYCSGLYDYLSDRVIKALNTYLYDQLAPGGLLTVGNFAPNTPVRQFHRAFSGMVPDLSRWQAISCVSPAIRPHLLIAEWSQSPLAQIYFWKSENHCERSRDPKSLRRTEFPRLHSQRGVWFDYLHPAQPLLFDHGLLHVWER